MENSNGSLCYLLLLVDVIDIWKRAARWRPDTANANLGVI